MTVGGARRLLRARGGELFLEGLLIVFAVLVALAVDEWNEGRELREQAGLARSAILAEMRANREEFLGSQATIEAVRPAVAEAVARLRSGAPLRDFEIRSELPDFSTAAWETAKVTGALARMDYDWMIVVARVYEAQEIAERVSDRVLQAIAGIVVDADREGMEDLQAQLFLLSAVFESLERSYGELLDAP